MGKNRLYMFFVFAFVIQLFAYSQNVLKMTVLENRRDEFLKLLAEKNKTVYEIDNLKSQYASRNVADIVIICQALKLANYPVKLEFITVPNYAREIATIESGEATIMHQEAFSIDFNDKVLKSPVVIEKGKFVKGLYVSDKKVLEYKIKLLADLEKVTCVSSDTWTIDWKTLSSIKLKSLSSAPTKEIMLKLVLMRDIDFTLQEFTNLPDMSYKTPDGRLLPLPGIKIALDDTRHFMISKTAPDGQKVYNALVKGLEILKKNGTIDRYYTEAGFFKKEIADWKLLNPIYSTMP